MCSKEAGAAATTAAVTASPKRGSNCPAALPPGSNCPAVQPPGCNCQAEQPPSVAEDQEILEFLTGVMRGGEGSTQTMKAAELLGKRRGLFSERAEPPPAPVIIDDVGPASRRAEERESG